MILIGLDLEAERRARDPGPALWRP